MLMVDGKMSMLLPMQAMGMLTMVQLMRVMGMLVVEAVVSGAVAGEVAMVVASLIISKTEVITRRPLFLHQLEVETASFYQIGCMHLCPFLIINRCICVVLQVVVEAVAVGEAAQLGAEGAVAMPMATWCMLPLRAHKQSAARCRR